MPRLHSRLRPQPVQYVKLRGLRLVILGLTTVAFVLWTLIILHKSSNGSIKHHITIIRSQNQRYGDHQANISTFTSGRRAKLFQSIKQPSGIVDTTSSGLSPLSVRPVLETKSVPSSNTSVKPPLVSSPAVPEALRAAADKCNLDPNNEYHGDVVVWGTSNYKSSAEECCTSCQASSTCTAWMWCGEASGCGNERGFKECWLKLVPIDVVMNRRGKGHKGIPWTAGSCFPEDEVRRWQAQGAQREADEAARLKTLREDPDLPLVYLDVAVHGKVLGRIEFVLFVKEAPRAAENMRQMCSGERGIADNGNPYSVNGSYFYRIIDQFIDQTGAWFDGMYDAAFNDDLGGLALKHDRKGLLSMANSGPNTNGGHFSIVVAPAPHLNGHYTIFGEVLSGFEHVETINHLSLTGPGGRELLNSEAAQIVGAGQIRRGSYVDTPQFKAVIQAERERINYYRSLPPAEQHRLDALRRNESLPMVFVEVAIDGVYKGRMDLLLYADVAPLASENLRLLCTGEAGKAAPGHEGAGRAYHLKGSHYYRIIDQFIDQTGVPTDSPLGGLFKDDPAGLALNHTRKGLLSMANIGRDTNGAHFSTIMAPARHLDGHYVIFGEVVSGFNIAEEVNALAKGPANHELLNSNRAQIINTGELRRGSILDSPQYKDAVAQERARLAAARHA